MIQKPNSAPLVRRALSFCAAAACATPALADHLGPSAFGSGAGMAVFDAATLDAAHWAAGLRLAYTRPDRRSDAELAALAGQHVHAHNTDYNFVASVSAAYGVTHHLTVSAELPFVRRDHLREGTHAHSSGVALNGVEPLGTVAGFGDATILAKYRLSEGEGQGFAFVAGIKLPTGSTRHLSLEGDRLETEHQPGTGSWDPIFGASASAPIGAVTVSASALYQLSTTGAQQTRLGDRLQGGLAVSHRLGSRAQAYGELHNHHHGDELDEHVAPKDSNWDLFFEVAGEWEGRQKVGGEVDQASGGAWVYAAPGVRFNKSRWSASASFAVPLWQHIRASHPNQRYRLTLSLGRAF